MGTHDRYLNKGLDKLKKVTHQFKEFDKSITDVYNKEPSKSDLGIDIIDNIINNSKKYRNENEGTRNYMENKKAFEDALMNVINKYYDNKDNSCHCSHYEEDEEEYTEEEMEALYDDYYKSEGEYDNECNADCYVCKKPNKKTCSANDNSSKEQYILVIKDQILTLGNMRKISWNIKEGENTTYLLGSGYYHRTITKETTIKDIENIYGEVLSCFLNFKNPMSNLNTRIVYNNIDLTDMILNNSNCSSYRPNTKLSYLI